MGEFDVSLFSIDRWPGERPAVLSLTTGGRPGLLESAQGSCMAVAVCVDGTHAQPTAALNEYAERQLRMQLRMIFRLVDQFMRLRRLEFERRRLEGLVQDLLVVVRECFATADLCLPDVAAMALNREQCLHDLEDLSRSIELAHPLPPPVLAHALDSVIVNCLILDSEQREIEKARLEAVAAPPT
jgi:hypothetical protein